MSNTTMMDCDGYSSSRQGMEQTPTDDSMVCDSNDGEWEEKTSSRTHTGTDTGTHKRSSGSTALAAPSMASRYGPTEMEGALRIMTHAGRILWRAAMEAIPGGVGSYNPSLRVLSKLFQRSFGASGYNNNNNSRSNNEDEDERENDNTTTRRNILPFSWGNLIQDSISGTPDQDHGVTEDLDEVMDFIPDYSSSDSVSASSSFEALEQTDGEMLSQPKKRKTLFGISALLPSVVSDSEEEEEFDVRPSKRVRRSFENESLVRCW